MPRRLDGIGRLVDALDEFLRRHHGEDSYRNQVQWLSGQHGDGGEPRGSHSRRR